MASIPEPQWSWPTDMDSQKPDTADGVSQSPQPDAPQPQPDSPGESHDEEPPAQGRRYYGPRTCRICLEEVQPTTEIDDSMAGRMFASKTRVRYISEDPELGRLISPCKCKGSQRYVHEGCLQAWRRSQPLAARNFWQCPTCSFQYRMERLRWSSWLSSKLLRVGITISILIVTVFLLGFVADPIINLWLDPFGSVVDTFLDMDEDDGYYFDDPVPDNDEPSSWAFHFVKGLASLGLLGFFKSFLVMSPWHWFSVRTRGVGRRRGTGRDRVDSINWIVIVVGIFTFLGVCGTLCLFI